MTVKAYIRYASWTDEFEVAIVNKAYDGRRFYLPEIKFVEVSPHEPVKPFFTYTGEGPQPTEILQAILDAAWEQGLRPTGFKDIKNETTAIKKHLDDMRRLVFAHQTPYNIIELDK